MKNVSAAISMLITGVLALAASYVPAHSQDVLTVGAGLAQASGTIDDIAKRAGNEANYVVFSGAAELKLLIESLRISARDVLGEGFNELNKSQQQLYDNIQKGVQSLSKAVNEPVEQGRQIVEEIHQIANDGLPWMRESVVLRSTPSVLAPTNLADIAFTVRGLSLDAANPRLYFGDLEAKRIDLKQQKTIFSVPAKAFKFQPAAPGLYSGRVRLTVRECSWLVLCSKVQREYQIGVMTLPIRLAEVSVAYNLKQSTHVYRNEPFSKRFGHSTGDLTHKKCTKETQGPHAPGYFIDVQSFSNRKTHGKARNSHEILGLSPTGFVVEMCVQAQMHTPFKKRSGEISVDTSWKEYRVADVVSEFANVPQGVLEWGSGMQHTLPPETNAVTVALQYFDGSRMSFIGNDADRYVDVKWNSGTRQLLITPKRPNSIDGIN